jgi:hypothetical protein
MNERCGRISKNEEGRLRHKEDIRLRNELKTATHKTKNE